MNGIPGDDQTISVLIVDDHPVFRAGLTNLLESQPDLRVVAAVGTSEAALSMWRQHAPHVVILDLSMPGTSGFEMLRRLREMSSSASVLVLTSSESADDAVRAARAGAAGFVTKNVDQEEIVAAIRCVHRGERCFPEWSRRNTSPSGGGPGGLSARELEVLGFLRHGHSNAAIGRILGITERTVKAHVAAILEKLNAADRAEAVAKGFDLGILKTVLPP
jgi:DNA-binding NarL/FixJ family response regulator